MRRIWVVVVLVVAASGWPVAGGVAHGSTAAPAAPAQSLQADFNDDGADDLAVGVPGEDIGGPPFNSGAVNVLYGSASGLSGTGSQLFTQASPGVPGNPGEGESFGDALASGDFDNDGFADLAVGVPGEGIGAAVAAGAVNVLYGSAGGLTGTGSQLFTQVGGAVEDGDGFGSALAAGDFDNEASRTWRSAPRSKTWPARSRRERSASCTARPAAYHRRWATVHPGRQQPRTRRLVRLDLGGRGLQQQRLRRSRRRHPLRGRRKQA